MNKKELNLNIESVNDISRCLTIASLLEVSGYPKPGNVHRTKDFEATRYEHFLAAIASLQPNYIEFCQRIYEVDDFSQPNYSYVSLGSFFTQATQTMMSWQHGGNVLLGHILIHSPLAAAATLSLKKAEKSFESFTRNIDRIISDATVDDTVQLYQAIKLCHPGGLGSVEKYDINNEQSINQLQADNIKLKKIFQLSESYDLISAEYSNCFSLILREGLPTFYMWNDKFNDVNISIINTFLMILASHPDTLIARKTDIYQAKKISQKAKEIISYDGLGSKKGRKYIIELDTFLQKEKGRLNPGTTADITAGIIFCALLFGFRF